MSAGSTGYGTAKPEHGDAETPTPQQPTVAHGPEPMQNPPPRDIASAQGEHNDHQPTSTVGTIGADSTAPARVVLTFDGSQAGRRLIGRPVWFEFTQDGTDNVVFGQITSVGAACSGDTATGVRARCGTMAIGGAFARSGHVYKPSALGTMPPAGTPVFEAGDVLIEQIAGGHADASYIGRFYGADAAFPASLPPFAASGAGPYNIGIYGARGSGKSSLARALIAAFARSPASSVFVIDPDGSLAGRNGDANGGDPDGVLGSMCSEEGKRFYSYGVGDLVLDRWDLFHDVLRESDMLRTLLPDEDRRDVFMGVVKAKFRTGGRYPMARLRERGAYDSMMELLCSGDVQEEIYPTERHVRSLLAKRIDAWKPRAYETHWLPLAELFNSEGRRKVSGMMRHACEAGKKRPVIVVDLSKRTAPDGLLWNDGVKAIVSRRIIRELAAHGEGRYGSGGRLDVLAVLCGAENMAPRRAPADRRLASLRDAAVELARSSRGYGLSLMFVSRTLAGLHRSLYADNRMSFYGSGLSSKAEEEAMSEVLPSGFAGTYRALVGPRADKGARPFHPFMSGGLATRLSSTEEPMFFTMDEPGAKSAAQDGAASEFGAAAE